MRITGGRIKGRILASPRGTEIRPTSDRVREAIFNLIGQDLSGSKVLDLFAGTGALGLEALSRGAQQAFFIDNSRASLELVKKNLVLCDFEPLGRILKWNLRKGFPSRHQWVIGGMDLVFLDPPYGKGFLPHLLKKLNSREILSIQATILAESAKYETLPDLVESLHLIDTRRYGDTKISIYRYEATE